MSLNNKLVSVPGRKQAPEKILFGSGKVSMTGPDVDWTRDLRTSQLLLAKELANWVVLTPGKWRRDAQAFIELIKRNASGMRFRVADPQM